MALIRCLKVPPRGATVELCLRRRSRLFRLARGRVMSVSGVPHKIVRVRLEEVTPIGERWYMRVGVPYSWQWSALGEPGFWLRKLPKRRKNVVRL